MSKIFRIELGKKVRHNNLSLVAKIDGVSIISAKTTADNGYSIELIKRPEKLISKNSKVSISYESKFSSYVDLEIDATNIDYLNIEDVFKISISYALYEDNIRYATKDYELDFYGKLIPIWDIELPEDAFIDAKINIKYLNRNSQIIGQEIIPLSFNDDMLMCESLEGDVQEIGVPYKIDKINSIYLNKQNLADSSVFTVIDKTVKFKDPIKSPVLVYTPSLVTALDKVQVGKASFIDNNQNITTSLVGVRKVAYNFTVKLVNLNLSFIDQTLKIKRLGLISTNV